MIINAGISSSAACKHEHECIMLVTVLYMNVHGSIVQPAFCNFVPFHQFIMIVFSSLQNYSWKNLSSETSHLRNCILDGSKHGLNSRLKLNTNHSVTWFLVVC